MDNSNIIETLSNYEHERWSRWMKYLFSKCQKNADGSVTIPVEYVNRWSRQMNTKYENLSESEKVSDRQGALMILALLKENKEEVIKILNDK